MNRIMLYAFTTGHIFSVLNCAYTHGSHPYSHCGTKTLSKEKVIAGTVLSYFIAQAEVTVRSKWYAGRHTKQSFPDFFSNNQVRPEAAGLTFGIRDMGRVLLINSVLRMGGR